MIKKRHRNFKNVIYILIFSTDNNIQDPLAYHVLGRYQ